MRMRVLSPKELKAAELYVLLNCEEVNPWIALFDYQVCSGLSEDQIQIKRQLEFIPWFKTTINEPFILASQAQQVFYARYPSQNPCRKRWFAACKIRARAIINTSSLSDGGNVYYQDNDPSMPQLVQPSTVLNDHVSLASQGGEEVVISEVMQLPYVTEEECVEVAAHIHTEVSQRVSEMEASFERRFQEHMRLLSQQYSMNATQPQTDYPSSAPPQTADPSCEGFRPDHFPPHS
ncbi:hypothetical protein SLEP1_g48690 [Rubroshorea leprosula]|uniref:DUF4216 domain-containing protein n=1 Tax=Rubroshorea leprosula TaxID=152421 RepID=A0AAV5LWH3_9ROSI|nr:hypothetical protein SLEP1_g48690 [Rubroshorea leprosula]